MTKFKLGFLKSSASSSDKFLLDNTSESSCGVTPSPKFKRFFTLRRKRNDSQSQRIRDLGQGNSSASPPRAITRVATALAITSSTSADPGKELAGSPFHSQPPPPALVDTSRQTGGSYKFACHSETTERVVIIDSMENYHQPHQESELMETTKTQKRSDTNSEINLHSTLSYYHSSTTMTSKIASPSPSCAEPDIASRAREERLRIQSSVQPYEVSRFQHVLEVLQRAARRVQADQSMSQLNIFRSLAPIAIFLYLLGIGVLVPRYRCVEENTSVGKMILLFFIGMGSALVFLRGMVWLMGVFGRAFCEVDLTEVFRRGECIDVDGRGMGEAELILGGIFI